MEATETNRAVVLPVYDALMLPHTTAYIHVGKMTDTMRAHFQTTDETTVALPLKQGTKGSSEDDFREVGMMFKLTHIGPAKNGYLLEVEALERVQVESLHREGDLFYAEYTVLSDVQDMDAGMREQMLENLKGIVREISSHFKGSDQYMRSIEQINDVDAMIVSLGRYTPLTVDEKYELISTCSQRERAMQFMDLLLKQREAVSWNIEVNERMSDQAGKFYRSQMLREQLKAIQAELDDAEGASGEGAKPRKDYRARIEESELPDEVREAALEEVGKLESSNEHNPETAVIRNYLDFILALPWKHEPAVDIDLAAAEDILNADHYGLEKVKKRIVEHLAVMQLRHDNKGSILLLVGPPGTGKTSLGKSVARALGREYVRLSLGGIRDESEIRGHRRTYVGALPGRILNGVKSAGTTNPVMVLDEVDKLMTGGFSGDPASALLEVLDPEQNSTFTDHYLDLPYDLSEVFFVATANSVETIPAPLLDRMEVIEISSYTEDEKFHIAKEHLMADVLRDNGLTDEQLCIEDDTICAIVADYTREGGVRGLKKKLASIARGVSAEIVKGVTELPRIVGVDDLDELLGRKTAQHDQVLSEEVPGVVTGLAWTPVGGEILFIEAASMPGNGKMTLTGQLGDVMQESAQISMSLLKSRLPLDTVDFGECDVHIHVPSGAVPKDGPSAGITIFTALASLFTGRTVDTHLAMTGEVTLRGAVMPIGGLKEKLLAAQRAGITRVLIPKENEPDLRDVPDEVKAVIEIVPVETVEDVLREAIGITIPRPEHLFFAANAAKRSGSAPAAPFGV